MRFGDFFWCPACAFVPMQLLDEQPDRLLAARRLILNGAYPERGSGGGCAAIVVTGSVFPGSGISRSFSGNAIRHGGGRRGTQIQIWAPPWFGCGNQLQNMAQRRGPAPQSPTLNPRGEPEMINEAGDAEKGQDHSYGAGQAARAASSMWTATAAAVMSPALARQTASSRAARTKTH